MSYWFLHIKSRTESPDCDDTCPCYFRRLAAAKYFKQKHPTSLRDFSIEEVAILIEAKS